MKPLLNLILCYFLISSSFAQKVNLNISLYQGAQQHKIRSSKINLSPDSFAFVFHFTHEPSFTPQPPSNVFVFATFQKKAHKQQIKALRRKKEVELAMAEGLFNTDKELIISDSEPSFWFYDDPFMHRFDWVAFNETESTLTIVCHRSIQQFYIKETKETIRVENYKGTLYVLFYPTNQKPIRLRITFK